eukprot:TRINITY_DN3013_c0_g1_i6.p1 TRINITY_DN3013_c0_g1~~TRINITY_DN3013_c0_g1_i6.p1  ORF type:complete len:241 (-),score=51.09 TRINITY_DN3013_c0_g1_i6:645-1367(-)
MRKTMKTPKVVKKTLPFSKITEDVLLQVKTMTVCIYPGLWFDDPRPSLYVPHLTILNSDPKWDRKLRVLLTEKKALKTGKRTKRVEHGRGVQRMEKRVRHRINRKNFPSCDDADVDFDSLVARPEIVNEEQVTRKNEVPGEENEQDEIISCENGESAESDINHSNHMKDPFGWNYSLMRGTRKEFSKISFGREKISLFELQANFKTIQVVRIDGRENHLQDTLQEGAEIEDGNWEESSFE